MAWQLALDSGHVDGHTVRLFVDGVEVGNGTPVTAPIAYALPYQYSILARSGICELRFNGDIDEVKIFNRALSGRNSVASSARRHRQTEPARTAYGTD